MGLGYFIKLPKDFDITYEKCWGVGETITAVEGFIQGIRNQNSLLISEHT
jgi:hypothetical protein